MYDATRHRRSILSCANNLRQCISNSVHLPSPQPCSSCHVSGFSIFAFLIHLFSSPISGSRRIEFLPIFFDCVCKRESLAGQSSPIGSPELLAHRLCHLRPIDPSIQSQLKVQRGRVNEAGPSAEGFRAQYIVISIEVDCCFLRTRPLKPTNPIRLWPHGPCLSLKEQRKTTIQFSPKNDEDRRCNDIVPYRLRYLPLPVRARAPPRPGRTEA